MSNSKEDEELRLLFQIFIDDIQALAGIITLSLWLASEQNLFQSLYKWLIASCFVIASLGIFYIRNYHMDLTKYRYRKDQIMNLIWPSKDKEGAEKSTKTVREILDGPSCDECGRLFFKEDFFSFVLPFWVVIIFTGALAIILIGFVACK
jgi:hypothetical protein